MPTSRREALSSLSQPGVCAEYCSSAFPEDGAADAVDRGSEADSTTKAAMRNGTRPRRATEVALNLVEVFIEVSPPAREDEELTMVYERITPGAAAQDVIHLDQSTTQATFRATFWRLSGKTQMAAVTMLERDCFTIEEDGVDDR